MEDINVLTKIVVDLFAAKGLTLGFAESLTGGAISSSVVNIPGASAVLEGVGDRGLCARRVVHRRRRRAVCRNNIRLDADYINAAIDKAIVKSRELGIKGKATTPFLLAEVKALTGGVSLDANIQLVLNNARLAAQTAVCLALCRRESA